MMSCEHFTIRGAVAEFRKKDLRLNCPFKADCKLRPEAVLLPLKIPKFRRWCCESCVADLIEDSSCEVSIVSEVGNKSKSDYCYFDNSAGTSAVLSDIGVVAKEDSSARGKDNGKARAATDTSMIALETSKLLTVENNAGVVINATDNSAQMKSNDAQTGVNGGQTTDSILPIIQRRTEFFDLNQIPYVEPSELALVADWIQCDEQKASVDLHAEPVKTPDPIVGAAAAFASEDNFNHPPEKGTVESSRVSGEAVTDCNVTVKKRTPKYRLLSELLSVKEEGSETVLPGGTGEIGAASLKNNCKLKKKRKLRRIQQKQGLGHLNLSKDEREEKIQNRTFDCSRLKVKGRMLIADKGQPSVMICDLMELALRNRSPSSSQIPWWQSKNALSGTDILNIVAAGTTNSGTVLANEKK
uniref:Uncharacterized protein n=1 Tax=Kalanchoe fedtschenkoi TaxID=63787 RepID=A0A7N0U8L5_KALFE